MSINAVAVEEPSLSSAGSCHLCSLENVPLFGGMSLVETLRLAMNPKLLGGAFGCHIPYHFPETNHHLLN